MIAILYREELKEYDFGPWHSFRGDRYETFPQVLRTHLAEGDHYRFLVAERASDQDLLKICKQEYIDFTKEYYQAANMGHEHDYRFTQYQSSDNRPLGLPGKVEEAARLVIGQTKKACDLVQAGEFEKAICIGGGLHHAKPNWGEGFCLYNDVAFAGVYLLENYGLERILILDTDAHAGNGTAEYFYNDPRVLFIDIHQDPHTIYPGTGFPFQVGEGAGHGYTVNVAMPMRAGDDSYKLAFDEVVLPLAHEFKPQIIIRNGGSDPHFEDSLTNLGLTLRGFRVVGEKVRKMAEVCGGKTIDMVGSGYNKEILPYAWLSLIAGLGDFRIELPEPKPRPENLRNDPSFEATKKMLQEVKRNLKDHWKCLEN
jgi:acetoin utilization protein AcuC